LGAAPCRCKFEHRLWKAPLVAGLYLIALVVAYSRLLFTHHTFEQVLVGAIVGFFMATLWYPISSTRVPTSRACSK
jgi:membrane-associated phospholipid phosphatase